MLLYLFIFPQVRNIYNNIKENRMNDNRTNYKSSLEILKDLPELRPLDLDYLCRNKFVEYISQGRGIPRMIHKDSIKIIEAFLNRRRDRNESK